MPPLPRPYSEKSASEWISDLQKASAPAERLRALQALAFLSSPEETIRWAAFSLRDDDSDVRALGAKLLGTHRSIANDDAEFELVKLLHDQDPDVRFESARTLIRRQSTKIANAIPILFQFLDEPETQPLMIAAVLNALAEIKLAQTVDPNELQLRVERLIDHEKAEVREAVSCVIVNWPCLSESLKEKLVQLLDDSEPIVRENIAIAFGKACPMDDAIRSALETASFDEDPVVARAVKEALAHLNR